MLLDNFFEISEINRVENNKLSVSTLLNPSHQIFEGHFPGNPIVPGVCLTHMITEILSGYFKKQLLLGTADQIKFLAIVNPNENKVLNFLISLGSDLDAEIKADVVISYEEKVFMKFKGAFVQF